MNTKEARDWREKGSQRRRQESREAGMCCSELWVRKADFLCDLEEGLRS